jgi:hypothetical protein
MEENKQWSSKLNIHALFYAVFCLSIVFLYVYFSNRMNDLQHQKYPKKIIKVNDKQLEFAQMYFDSEAKFIENENLNQYLSALYQMDSLFPNQKIIELKLQFLSYFKSLVYYNPEEIKENYNAKINNLNFNWSQKMDSLIKIFKKDTNNLNQEIYLLNALVEKYKQQNQIKNKIQVLSFVSSKGHKVSYIGEVLDGKANGGGEGVWSTGSIYKGDWKNNLRHGKGKFEWIDGQVYEGDFKMGKKTGFGIYKWPSGERYEGYWNDDKRNGNGKLFDRDGNLKYDGMWEDDKPLK